MVDGRHVETGSFNFTVSAAKRNSENVLVLWNNPTLANRYITTGKAGGNKANNINQITERFLCESQKKK